MITRARERNYDDVVFARGDYEVRYRPDSESDWAPYALVNTATGGVVAWRRTVKNAIREISVRSKEDKISRHLTDMIAIRKSVLKEAAECTDSMALCRALQALRGQ